MPVAPISTLKESTAFCCPVLQNRERSDPKIEVQCRESKEVYFSFIEKNCQEKLYF